MTPHKQFSARQIIARIRRMEFTDSMIGGVVGALSAGAVFTCLQIAGMDLSDARFNEAVEVEKARIIEGAQLQISGALAKADAFRDSLFCAAQTVVCGCERYEPKVKLC